MIIVPQIDRGGHWKPESPNYDEVVSNVDNISIHHDLYELYKGVRYLPITIKRKNYLITLEPLVDKEVLKGKRNCDFFFSLKENGEIYFVLGKAEAEYHDYAVVFKNDDGSILLLDEDQLYPFYRNLSLFLGNEND